MLRSFTVSNYRSFRAPATISVRPITILLGRNSAGKSSLTRLIPLLQDSLDRQTSSPVLWTTNSVDFGNIDNVINHDARSETVNITFEVDPDLLVPYLYDRSPFYAAPESLPSAPDIMSFTARLSEDKGLTRYQSSVISVDDDRLEIFWAPDGKVKRLTINGRTVEDFRQLEEMYADITYLFPDVERRSAVTAGALYRTRPVSYPRLQETFEQFIHQRTSQKKRASVVRGLIFTPQEESAGLPLAGRTRDQLSKLWDTDGLDQFSEASLVSNFPALIQFFDREIRPVIASAGYLGPARASGARFYRIQELSVAKVDASGTNLAMYLKSLSDFELAAFNKMLGDACGYVVRIETIPGHLSIELGELGSNRFENLADVGFGFSQFLPIVAQIHASTFRPSNVGPARFNAPALRQRLIAVEQPELHLHPAFQASLADLFVSSAVPDDPDQAGVSFIIETHSEALISRLSALIASGRIQPDDVALYFVEKDEKSKDSTVIELSFSDDGEIEEWPTGFFAPATQ